MNKLILVIFAISISLLFAVESLTVLTHYLLNENEFDSIQSECCRGGDVNNDGFDDYLRYSVYPSVEYGYQCFISCYFGSSEPETYPDSVYSFSETENEDRGIPVWGGDLNGDSQFDLITVSSDLYSYGFISFQDIGFNLSVDTVVSLDTYPVVSICHDFNGDGYDDILCKSRYHPVNHGTVSVYFGGDQIDYSPNLFITNLTDLPNNGGYPQDVTPIIGMLTQYGDINGDGIDDLLYSIGPYMFVYDKFSVYCGGISFGNQTIQFDTIHNLGQIGNAAANGDINGDGCDDLCMIVNGMLYIYWGSSELDFLCTIYPLNSDFVNTKVYYCNINNDEYDDLIVKDTCIDEVYIYFGGESISTVPDLTIPIEPTIDGLSYNVGGDIGDINGDGRDDILVNDGGDMRSATVYYMDTSSNEENIQPLISDISNYPNPFNPTTTISFSIPNSENVNLSIYNIHGQKVKELASGSFERGKHSLVWDGKSDNGKNVSSGVYFYNLRTSGESITHKMILLK